jgi:hypothetical protein
LHKTQDWWEKGAQLERLMDAPVPMSDANKRALRRRYVENQRDTGRLVWDCDKGQMVLK